MSTIINATTTNGVVIQPDNSGSLVLQTNSGTTALTIDTSQNVGIGISSPTSLLDVRQSNPTRGIIASVVNTATSSQTGAQIRITQNGIEDWVIGQPAAVNAFAIWSGRSSSVDGSERMRIDSSGRLFAGTTASVGGASARLTLSSPNLNSSYGGIGIKNEANENGGYFVHFVNYNNAVIGSINQNATTTVAYATSSDYRLKENIAPMVGALDKVSQLKPVTYTWKQDGSDGQGFIAHELQEIVPDCVTGEKDAVDADGNPKYQGVDTSFLVATLTAAIQEQQTIINDLKARVETLEAKLG
jgi:hypothetical protein